MSYTSFDKIVSDLIYNDANYAMNEGAGRNRAGVDMTAFIDSTRQMNPFQDPSGYINAARSMFGEDYLKSLYEGIGGNITGAKNRNKDLDPQYATSYDQLVKQGGSVFNNYNPHFNNGIQLLEGLINDDDSGHGLMSPVVSAIFAGTGADMAAGGSSATAGGGEVGSGYASSAPGSASGGSASTGYDPGGEGMYNDGASAGSTGSENLSGSSGGDTMESGNWWEESGNWDTTSTDGTFTADSTDASNFSYDPGAEGTYQTPSTNPLPSFTENPGMWQQAQSLAKQFGITPMAAAKALWSTLSKAAPAALGVLGASRQSDSLQALAEKYSAHGAPSRARYEASYAPGFTLANEPGYKDALDQTTKSFLHKASIRGNPADSPNAWQQTLKDVGSSFAFPALQAFRGMNANTGGIASFAPASISSANSAIGADANIFNALGGMANDIFSPKKSLAEQLAEMKAAGLY